MTKETILAMDEAMLKELKEVCTICVGSGVVVEEQEQYGEYTQNQVQCNSCEATGYVPIIKICKHLEAGRKAIEEAEQRGYTKGFAENKTHVINGAQIKESIKNGKIEVLRELIYKKEFTGRELITKTLYGFNVRIENKIQQLEKEG